MKTWRRIAALVACCCAGTVMASQPPGPTPGKPGQSNQYEATQKESKAEPKHQPPGPQPAVIDEGSAKATAKDQHQAGGAPDRDAASKRWSIAATVLNLFFTGCLVLLMYLQWRAMQQQERHMKTGLTLTGDTVKAAQASADAASLSADTARRALELAERADVLIEMIMVSSGSIRRDTIVTVVLKNYGRTRAVNLFSKCSLYLTGHDKPKGFTNIHSHASPIVLGAGGRLDVPFVAIGQWLSDEIIDMLNGVKEARISLGLEVKIEYNDVFKGTRDHSLGCSGIYDRNSGTFPMSTGEADG